MKHCPQCGCDTPELHEGYCEECCRDNQAALDQHNAAYSEWQGMTDVQRDKRIRDAIRLSGYTFKLEQ